jgi:hypothetical protein
MGFFEEPVLSETRKFFAVLMTGEGSAMSLYTSFFIVVHCGYLFSNQSERLMLAVNPTFAHPGLFPL